MEVLLLSVHQRNPVNHFHNQSTLRPTKWVTLECTKNNSTEPRKPMNIIRNSLLAKITLGYLKWLWAYGRNYYVHQHPNSYVFANYSYGKSIAYSTFKVYFSTGNNQQ